IINKRDKGDRNDIPEQIKDNISSNEQILHYAQWNYTPLGFKLAIIALYGTIIASIITICYGISKGVSVILEYWTIYLLIFPISLIMILIVSRFIKRVYFIVITDQNLHLFTKLGRENVMDSVGLDSIKAIALRKKFFSRSAHQNGKIVIVSSNLSNYQKNKIILQNIQNFEETFKKFESILWYYGKLKERLQNLRSKENIEIPHTFQLNKKAYNRIDRYVKFFNVGIIICLVAISLGILFVFLKVDFMVNIFLLIFGCGFLGFFLGYKIIFKKFMVPLNTGLILESNRVTLRKTESSETVFFNEKSVLDFLQTQDLKKSSIGSYESVGSIIIKESINSPKLIKFGPIVGVHQFLEIIYLHLLEWKGEQGILIAEELIRDFKKKEIKEKVQDFEDQILPEAVDIDDEILKQVQNYLEPNEQVLFTHKPIVNLKKQIIFSILGIISFILLYISISLSYHFQSINLFVIVMFAIMIPMLLGTFTLCALPGIIMEKKSLFVFTNEKIIIKYPKQFLITKLNNIASINRSNKRKKYHLMINLKKELENSPYINKSEIAIRNILKEDPLLEKIKKLRELVEKAG
ncbi:MAG: hypothetical protein ACFFA3_20305, partial [Promethearchaeota archaeon]